MAEYINREELIKDLNKFAPEHYSALVNTLIEKQPAADVVSVGVLQQVMWEIDIAISQLESYGVGFAEEADVTKVKHGKWLRTDAYPHRVYCSVCHKTYVTNEEVIRGRSWEYPAYCTEAEYCPHCGAKMDGSEDDE